MFRKLPAIMVLLVSLVMLSAMAPTTLVAESPQDPSSGCQNFQPIPCQSAAAHTTNALLPPQVTSELKMTVIYDNVSTEPTRLVADWGYAALLEYAGHTILFDTGTNGTILLFNMKQLGIDPASIEAVIISHENDDHYGGLQGLFDLGLKPPVYMPCMFTKKFKESISAQTKLIEVSDVTEVIPGMRLTRPMGCIVEQALAVDTPAGTVVITGCAHPGIVNIVRAAQEVTGENIALIAGGFHFFPLEKSELPPIISELQAMGVERAMPAHCTAEDGIALFKATYGDKYVPAGVGAVYTVTAPKS